MGSRVRKCSLCSNGFSDVARECPHCGRPALYVNVHRAEDAEEKIALQARYEAALSDARVRKCEHVLLDFERALLSSKAVLSQKRHVVETLINSDSRIYPTFYKECLAGIRLPEGSEWDELRDSADNRLFGQGKSEIHFAALTMDGCGSSYYGDYHMHFREDLIEYRTTAFETNSALFPERFPDIMSRTGFPLGYRALWQERQLLCVAKLASKISPATRSDQYSAILLTPDQDPRKEEFVEVHIWGPFTIRTLERIVVAKDRLDGGGARRKKLMSDLGRFGVILKVI